MTSNRVASVLVAIGTAAAFLTSAPTLGKEAGEPVAMSPQKLEFIEIPDMPKCASAAILRGNPRSGPAYVLLKLASGCRVPWHWHTPNALAMKERALTKPARKKK